MRRATKWLLRHEGLIILVAVTALLRIPSLFEPYWYGDEQIYLAIGQAVRKGLVLYRDITDYPNKPPLIYLLAALAGTLFWFKLMLLVWNAVHLTVVNRLLRQLWTNQAWLVWGGSIAFMLLTSLPLLEGNIANGEMFMAMPATAAMGLLWSAQSVKATKHKSIKYFLAGLLFSLGFLFKIPVAAEVVAAILVFWWFSHKLINRDLISFGLGFGLPVALVLLIWSRMGVAPGELIKNAVGSAGYVSAWQTQWLSLPGRLGLAVGASGAVYLLRRRLNLPLTLGLTWLIWALWGATLSARPYPHYFIQIVVPLIVTVGAMLTTRDKLPLAAGTLGLVALGLTWVILKVKPYPVGRYYKTWGRWITGQSSFEQYSANFDARMPRNYALAYYLKTHTLPKDKIYIWGNQPDVYVMADRLPAGKLVTSFHVEDLQAYEETLNWLQTDPPKFVVVMADETREFAELKSWLEQHYLEAVTIKEAAVYRRL